MPRASGRFAWTSVEILSRGWKKHPAQTPVHALQDRRLRRTVCWHGICALRLRLQPEEDITVQDENPAAAAARELKAATREALRIGSQWTHHAIQWVDERRNEMNNRNREQEQRERERAERNRYSTSGYGSDEGDYGPGQYGPQNEQSGLPGGRRGPQPHARDRDVQGDYSSGARQHGRGSQQGYGRAASDLQQGSSQGYGAQRYGAGSESFHPQDLSQDYSQGSSHYGAQDLRGTSDYERPYGHGGYNREGYGGTSQQVRGYGASPGEWRASDTSGRSYGQGQYAQSPGSRSGLSGDWSGATSYRGRGPKNYTRSDERIREDLNERLTDSDDIDASNITVEVSNGVAILKGSVDERWMKHRAEDLAESCSGVRDVNNQIRVQSQAASQGTSRSPISGSSASSGNSPDLGSSPGASSGTATKTGGSSTHN